MPSSNELPTKKTYQTATRLVTSWQGSRPQCPGSRYDHRVKACNLNGIKLAESYALAKFGFKFVKPGPQRITMKHRALPLFALALTTLSCGSETTPEDTPTDVVVDACTGPKCDGVSDRFRDLYDDMKDVSTDDLKIVGAALASGELNDALGDVSYTDIAISETALYGNEEEVLGQTIVRDINEISAGLTSRLGEEAFATKITNLRKNEIASKNVVYAESHFRIGPELNPDWSFSHGDALGTVGFLASATIESIVIAPFSDRTEALVDNPLQTMKNTRGFVIPKDAADIQGMAPGESMTLRADGALGFNMGVGVPFHVASLGSTVALNARLSFAARVALDGLLDVQLVRGENDEAFVDVGLSNSRERHFEVALDSGWGVSGLPEASLDLGVATVDVTEIAEKSLAKQLNKAISLHAEISQTKQESRLTVARFKINLNAADEDINQAIAQAMRGDIRFAQTLSNQAHPGIVQELDISKDARSEANYIGFRFLGMEFYRANEFSTGTVSIDRGDSSQTLLFNELEKGSGFFFTDRDMAWRTLVSLESQNGRLTNAELNARITLREKDKFLERDQMLDHVDPLLGYFTGFDSIFTGYGQASDALASVADNLCDAPEQNASFAERQEFRECIENLPNTTEYQQNFDIAEDRYNDAMFLGGFDPQFSTSEDFARPLFDFKQKISGTNERTDIAFDEPEGRLLTQIRFSDQAVHEIMNIGRHEDFRVSLEQVLRIMAMRRTVAIDNKQDHIDDYIDDRSGRLDQMAELYAQATVDFANFDDISGVELFGSELGNHGQLVTVTAEREMELASIAEHKANVLEGLYPELVSLSEEGIFNDLDEPGAFVVGYALLWLSEPSTIELLTNIVFDEDEEQAPENVDLYGRGTAPMIEAGLFDIDVLLKAE